MGFAWGSLWVLMAFSWGCLGVLMVQIIRKLGFSFKLRLNKSVSLGVLLGVFLGFSCGSLAVLTRRSGTAFEVGEAFCWYVDW